MKKSLLSFITLLTTLVLFAGLTADENYQGVENCKMCHSGTKGSFPGFSKWEQTLHAKIHLLPSPNTMIGDYTKEVNMGAAYSNAKAGFRIDGADYYVVLKPVTGEAKEYKVVYTYGEGWKQRYLVKIEDSYYMPPVQWNLNGYMDNSTGAWVAYNPQNWFNADGSLKPINNAFRTKSWDKNCAGCHSTPGDKNGMIELKVNANKDSSWVYKWANNNSVPNIVITCESCHGVRNSAMGAGHVNNLKSLPYDRKIEVCGQCHQRGTDKTGAYEYPSINNMPYRIGDTLSKYYIDKPGLWPDGSARQHHQQIHDLKKNKHYNSSLGITCVTCHDPHQNTEFKHHLKENFRGMENGQGCIKCHTTYLSTDSKGINNHTKHKNSEANCVSCHLPKVASSGKGYDISSHTFKVISPKATLDYIGNAATKGNPNSCALSCHRNGQGNFGKGDDFEIKDATLSDWTEASDKELAQKLYEAYAKWWGTDVKVENGVPIANYLGQNYPNPVINNTTIPFEVVKASKVQLSIYNIQGELVTILDNTFRTPGKYSINWDGKTHEGYSLISGNYYLIMSINDIVVAQRSIYILR